MKCSYCSTKIENVLKELKGVKSSHINLITEKGMVVVEDELALEEIRANITKMGFNISSFNKIDNSTNNKSRFLSIICNDLKKFNESLKDKIGIITIKNQSNDLIIVEYDPNLVKGWEIYEALESVNLNFTYVNELVNNLNEIDNFSTSISKGNFIFCIILTFLLIFNTMILPKFTFGDYFMSVFIIKDCLSVFLFITLILSTIIFIKYGLTLIKRSFLGFYYFRLLNMETLITLGSLSSLALTILNLTRLFLINNKNYKEELDKYEMNAAHSIEAAATVISITIIGKYIEEKAKLNIKKQTSILFSKEKLAIGVNALKVSPGDKKFDSFLSQKKLDVGLLEKDDYVKINNGEFLLYDSIIISGEVYVNESMTYGYEKIEKRVVGDRLKSGCEIEKGTCIASVTEVLEDSILFKVTKEMNDSLNQKLKFQIFVDRIIVYFVPIIILISLITFTIWLFIYIFNSNGKEYLTLIFVIERSISVLVVSCPCAFGLAIPTVTTISLNTALKNGILVKNLALLPEIKNTENFVFDKTGTLTQIKKEVKLEYESNKVNIIPVYSMIALCEKDQKHPIAEIIYSFCLKKTNNEESSTISLSSQIEKLSNGLSAIFLFSNSNTSFSLSIGSKKFIQEKSEKIVDEREFNLKPNYNSSVIYVTVDKEILIIFSIDTSTVIRKEAYQTINFLKNLNKNIYILSGDNLESVRSVGSKLGIDEDKIFGEIDNIKKKEFFIKLKNSNMKSMMIGDGINDILSLSEADFGISFNASTQLNLIAADIIFIKEDLNLIIILLQLSKLTFIFIWINIFWAFIYNLCLLPITAGAFFSFWNVEISPTLSSFFMLCSSFIIILTSNSLKLFNLNRVPSSKKQINHTNYVSLKDENNTLPSINSLDVETQKKNGKYYESV